MRGVTSDFDDEIAARKFQPALPMRGVTRRATAPPTARRISTRTPHAGSDAAHGAHVLRQGTFQPALPMRGVTAVSILENLAEIFQPALPMRGVTVLWWAMGMGTSISTRTPHAGSDRKRDTPAPSPILFQPALPMRGVTNVSRRFERRRLISTRTPHAGSDPSTTRKRSRGTYFNPHSPCGE